MENAFFTGSKTFSDQEGKPIVAGQCYLTGYHIKTHTNRKWNSLSLSPFLSLFLLSQVGSFSSLYSSDPKRARRGEVSSLLKVSSCGKARKAGECDVAQVIIQTLCTNSRWYVPMLMPIAMRLRVSTFEQRNRPNRRIRRWLRSPLRIYT